MSLLIHQRLLHLHADFEQVLHSSSTHFIHASSFIQNNIEYKARNRLWTNCYSPSVAPFTLVNALKIQLNCLSSQFFRFFLNSCIEFCQIFEQMNSLIFYDSWIIPLGEKKTRFSSYQLSSVSWFSFNFLSCPWLNFPTPVDMMLFIKCSSVNERNVMANLSLQLLEQKVISANFL